METGLSSKATPVRACFPVALALFALAAATPVAAQDDSAATPPAAEPVPAPPAPEPPPRINLLVTVPRAEANQAALQQCRDEADAGQISGEIVVCAEQRQGKDSPLTGDRAATQKRYAEETALKGAPRAPEAFGIPDNGKGIGFGGVPPPAYMVDFEVLPTAPAGSDADRIARGLPPLGEERELTEEEEKARREAAGIKTALPPRPKKKGG
jgi:hypothetical protein